MDFPIKYAFSGDEKISRGLVKLGALKMQETEEFMRFQGLSQLKQVFDIAPGVVIMTQKVFGIRQVFIHVDPFKAGGEKEKRTCLCNCNFAFGIIVEEQEPPLDDQYPLYTVLVCRREKFYVIEKDLLPSDWSKYIPGQKVVLIPYNEMLYRCCDGSVIATGCAPIPSEDPQASAEWRTTMRILPWRAFPLRKWLVTNG